VLKFIIDMLNFVKQYT